MYFQLDQIGVKILPERVKGWVVQQSVIGSIPGSIGSQLYSFRVMESGCWVAEVIRGPCLLLRLAWRTASFPPFIIHRPVWSTCHAGAKGINLTPPLSARRKQNISGAVYGKQLANWTSWSLAQSIRSTLVSLRPFVHQKIGCNFKKSQGSEVTLKTLNS